MRNFELKKREILDRVDIVEFVGRHVALKRRGQRWVGLCPFHSERTPSFTVTPDLGLFKCFGCGKGGDIFSFVQARENVPFIEAMQMLADHAGVELDSGSSDGPSGPGRVDIARVNDWAARFFQTNLQNDAHGASTRRYLSDRGFAEETVERFGLGLATDSASNIMTSAKSAGFDAPLLLAADLIRRSEDGRTYETFRNRLMFPIRDATGRIVGFGGRTLVDDRAKYLNTRQNALFDKGRTLYGLDVARDPIGSRGRAIIVEGYTDCLAAYQAGHGETVATLGTALTDAHVELLRRYTDEFILLFDSDDAGAAAADRAINVALPRCVRCRMARVPDGMDPGDFLNSDRAAEFPDLLNAAVDALEFKWSVTWKRFRGDASNARRRDAILEFLRVVAEAVGGHAIDPIQRGLLINQVAHVVRLERDEVERMLRRLQPRAAARREVQTVATVDPEHSGDAAQRTWERVLEVLLNEPSLLAVVGAMPDLSGIADDRDRRIAEFVLELDKSLGEFRLNDVLARCEKPADTERVAELAQRGARRGNHEATFRTALEQLQEMDRMSTLDYHRRRLLDREIDASAGESHAEDEHILSAGVRQRRHFVPRRLSQRDTVIETMTTTKTEE